MPSPKWTFASRFRRSAFGWRSSLPIQRLKDPVSEIRSVARTDRALAAEGAVLLLEKLSPALEQVDSSSGALGSAVNRTIDTLVPVIVAADITLPVPRRWLDRPPGVIVVVASELSYQEESEVQVEGETNVFC